MRVGDAERAIIDAAALRLLLHALQPPRHAALSIPNSNPIAIPFQTNPFSSTTAGAPFLGDVDHCCDCMNMQQKLQNVGWCTSSSLEDELVDACQYVQIKSVGAALSGALVCLGASPIELW